MKLRTIRYGVTALAACCLPLAAALARRRNNRLMIRGSAGDPGAGDTYTDLKDPSNPLNKLFVAGQAEFVKQDEVVADGLGPRIQPGQLRWLSCTTQRRWSSPRDNPQFAFFNAPPPRGVNHSANKLRSFITDKGPEREGRFKSFDYDTTRPNGCPGPIHHCRNDGRGKLQVYTSLTSKSEIGSKRM